MVRLLSFFFILFFLVSCNKRLGREEKSFKKQEGGNSIKEETNLANKCSSLSECVEACDQIYPLAIEKEKCSQLSIRDVEAAYKVAAYLQDPVARNLRRIREDEWNIFLQIGTEAINYYIDGYNVSESRRVLTWLAEEREISHVLFYLGPRVYRKILLNLFRVTEPAEKALHKSLNKGNTFYKICNNRSNDYAIYMVHQVIAEDLCRVSRFYSGLDLLEVQEACILRVYCHDRGGQYIHANDFRYISRVIEYDKVFDYIQEEDTDLGLNLDYDTINPEVCDIVCGLIPDNT